jgi:hypothetical protein
MMSVLLWQGAIACAIKTVLLGADSSRSIYLFKLSVCIAITTAVLLFTEYVCPGHVCG